MTEDSRTQRSRWGGFGFSWCHQCGVIIQLRINYGRDQVELACDCEQSVRVPLSVVEEFPSSWVYRYE